MEPEKKDKCCLSETRFQVRCNRVVFCSVFFNSFMTDVPRQKKRYTQLKHSPTHLVGAINRNRTGHLTGFIGQLEPDRPEWPWKSPHFDVLPISTVFVDIDGIACAQEMSFSPQQKAKLVDSNEAWTDTHTNRRAHTTHWLAGNVLCLLPAPLLTACYCVDSNVQICCENGTRSPFKKIEQINHIPSGLNHISLACKPDDTDTKQCIWKVFNTTRTLAGVDTHPAVDDLNASFSP